MPTNGIREHDPEGIRELSESLTPAPFNGKHASFDSDSDDDVERGRPSALLISRAAANRPVQSPATMWIEISDSENDDEENSSIVEHLFEQSPSGLCTQVLCPVSKPPPTPHFRRYGETMLVDALPPTFRQRKAAAAGGKRAPTDDEDASIFGTLCNSDPALTQAMPPPEIRREPSAIAQAQRSVSLERLTKGTAVTPMMSEPAQPLEEKPHRSPYNFRKRVREDEALQKMFSPNKYSDERPVDALRVLYPTTFTKSHFLLAAAQVVTPKHCLGASEFWNAFQSVEYVGEGSFGLVWRCVTLDNDLVAVKSCPISLDSSASIDDAYSVLREVAVMRFLNEQKVPYVLPLHNAFFVDATEVLPPQVKAALEIRNKLIKEELRRRRLRPRKAKKYASAGIEPLPPILTAGEEAILSTTKLPKFLAISDLDALESQATLFLVTELCDGDVESIERNELVTNGVAFCVSSALTEMHKLGLVHLDLKPSNILYAYERQTPEVAKPPCDGSTPVAVQTPSRQRLSSRPEGSTPKGHHQHAIKFYLSDFGNCHIVGPSYVDEVCDAVGTYEYMDTKALAEKKCSRATDCWSLGCTLYELINGRRLYPECSKKSWVRITKSSEYRRIFIVSWRPFPPGRRGLSLPKCGG